MPGRKPVGVERRLRHVLTLPSLRRSVSLKVMDGLLSVDPPLSGPWDLPGLTFVRFSVDGTPLTLPLTFVFCRRLRLSYTLYSICSPPLLIHSCVDVLSLW